MNARFLPYNLLFLKSMFLVFKNAKDKKNLHILSVVLSVRQGCLLSPTLFNIFLERIMSDALEEHDGKVSIGGRNIANLRFADDIDAVAEEEQNLEALLESLGKTCTRYKMEISAEKTKLMTNSANGSQRERDKGKRTEVGHCNKLQVPWSSCFR